MRIINLIIDFIFATFRGLAMPLVFMELHTYSKLIKEIQKYENLLDNATDKYDIKIYENKLDNLTNMKYEYDMKFQLCNNIVEKRY